MYWRVYLGPFKVYFGLQYLTRYEGVRSDLPDGRHIILWDYDDLGQDTVFSELRRVQWRFRLSNIYVHRTSEENKFHAICFSARTFREVAIILLASTHCDLEYVKLGLIRGYWDLRINKLAQYDLEPVAILTSPYPADVSPEQVVGRVRYLAPPKEVR
ncbi:MAG: hypothetical protein QXI60_03325 [Thermofilaceae archaeon]